MSNNPVRRAALKNLVEPTGIEPPIRVSEQSTKSSRQRTIKQSTGSSRRPQKPGGADRDRTPRSRQRTIKQSTGSSHRPQKPGGADRDRT
ncbi:MAG: hypothetical protein ACOY95_02610, partial [Pseudomonadota bacterium]